LDIYRQTLAIFFQLVYCQIYQAGAIYRSSITRVVLTKYAQLDQAHPHNQPSYILVSLTKHPAP